MSWQVWLRSNEHVNGQLREGMGGEIRRDVFVAEFSKRRDALAYAKASGYVANLADWMQGRAKWQACYRIERVAA